MSTLLLELSFSFIIHHYYDDDDDDDDGHLNVYGERDDLLLYVNIN